MKFRFLVPLYTPTGIIPEGSVLDLTPAQFAQYKGHGNDHLEPVDEPPKEPEAPKEPTRADLLAEAKALGVKNADGMKKDELAAAIAEAKAPKE